MWQCIEHAHTHTLRIWLRAHKPSWLGLGHIMACTSPSPVQNNNSAIQSSVRENVKQKERGGEWESMWEALFLVYGHWCCWRLGCSGGGTAQWLQLFWHEERPAGHSKPTTLSFLVNNQLQLQQGCPQSSAQSQCSCRFKSQPSRSYTQIHLNQFVSTDKTMYFWPTLYVI